MAQSFPSFALAGPLNLGEIASTLAALGLALDTAEVAWPNLETDIGAI